MGIMIREYRLWIGRLNMGMQHLDIRGEEYKINLLGLLSRNTAEIMIGEIHACSVVRHMISIIHPELIGYHSSISLILLSNIEVTRYDSGITAYNLLDLAHNQPGTLTASRFAYMVKVRIYRHEYPVCLPVLELDPAGNTLQGSIPPF